MAMVDEVAARLEARGVTSATAALALTAMTGEAELEAELATPSDGAEQRPRPDDTSGTDGGGETGTAAAAHLRRIRVRGFRGIGPEVDLDLTPGPGLTLVVGRNGSGKSSFAEAVELALTGANARWEKRSKVWRGGWRNLHAPDEPRIAAEFTVDGQAGTTVVERRWRSDADLDGATLSVRTPAGPSSLVDLGWSAGLDLYRPFLPYSELGAMVDEGPTSLHDALAAVLGLDEMSDATKRLKDARLRRERAWKATVKDGEAIADELEVLDDDRAATAATQLRARHPDLEVLAELAAGTGEADVAVARLRELAGLRGPDLDEARRVARELDDALAAAADHTGTDGARDLEVAELLAAARRVHADHGDGACPVCGTGQLDDRWAVTAERRERELRATAAAVRRTQEALAGAERALRELVRPAPGIVQRAGVVGVDAGELLRAYEGWEAVPRHPDPRQRPSALLTAADRLASAVREVRDQATALLRDREDAWRPAAIRLSSWLDAAVATRAATHPCPPLKEAEQQLSRVLDELRSERWTPIAEQARQVWASLRQRSNVSIEDVALAGTGVRRRVEVKVTVDGVEGAALGVMSQGELHALALSLFLPRATLPESPFRFLVLDDPVQSMDPSRVDGLARVLDAVAMERQVVVFTHDDRLPEAVRRLGITARVLEVTRGTESRVTVRETAAPWRRHLDDARALASSSTVPELVRRTAVPGFCRLALEAACVDAVHRQQLGRGAAHEEVGAALAEAGKLLPKLSLALFGTAARAGEVYARLNGRVGGWATDAVKACNEGSHGRFQGDPKALVTDVEGVITGALS
jgi:recombinational DNA repair ATPase RecF